MGFLKLTTLFYCVIAMSLLRIATWNARGGMYDTRYLNSLLIELDICVV